MIPLRQAYAGLGRCFSTSQLGSLQIRQLSSGKGNSKKIQKLFEESTKTAEYQKVLDWKFRQKASQMITRTKSLKDFSPEEEKSVSAFVMFDEDFQEKARLLFESNKPIVDFSPEENRTMELYVNFDMKFHDCIQDALWKDFPSEEADRLRDLYANFDIELKKNIEKLLRTFSFCSDMVQEKQKVYIYVNYNREFHEKVIVLISGTAEFDQMTGEEKNHLIVYVNMHQAFAKKAKALMMDFQSLDTLNEDEKKAIRLYISHNRSFQNEVQDWSDKPACYADYKYKKRFFNCVLHFNKDFREKVTAIAMGKRRFRELLPEEKNLANWYVNCTDGFKKNALNYTPTHEKAQQRATKNYAMESYAMCDTDFLFKAKELVWGDRDIAAFTRGELDQVKIYTNYNNEFREGIKLLLTQSFEQLSSTDKRLLSLYFTLDSEAEPRMKELTRSTRELDDFSPEENKFIGLYLNCDKWFQNEAIRLISSNKDCRDFSFDEARIVQLYVNFHVNFQITASKLIGEYHKKGGFHDIDDKLRYAKMKFLSYPLVKIENGKIVKIKPNHEPVEAQVSPKEPPPMEDFNPEENRTLQLHVNFHLGFRKTINQIVHREIGWNRETTRIFHLGMWYDHDLRERVNTLMWDKQAAEKITMPEPNLGPGPREEFYGRKFLLDSARRIGVTFFSKDDWTYLHLGHVYYDVPSIPGE